MNRRALVAEFVGSFTFVAAVTGAAMFSTAAGGGPLAVALAAGLSFVAMAYAVGHVSGGHFNPAVTVGLVAGGRFDTAAALPYIIAQVAGGLVAAAMFFFVLGGAIGGGGAPKWHTFPQISNVFGVSGGFSMTAAMLVEAVFTALLVIVIMGATSKRASAGFAPIAIGFALAVFYLVAGPISNASLNPARSTAAAVLAGGTALADLWVFWLAPMAGGAIGGALAKWLQNE